jgi:capsular polysaccharide biosynthesis protein/Mrp family chromosome partitioning ATPase
VYPSDDATAGGFAQLAALLHAVRRRWRLVALIVVAAGATAFALTVRQTKQYEATSQVFISQANPVSSVLSRTDARPPDPERDFNTRVALIKEPLVAARVDRRLRLGLGVDALLAKVTTATTATSDIADITARDADPRRAAAIADAFAREYVVARQEAVRGRVQQAVALAARQLASLSPADRASRSGRDLADRLRELQIDAQLQTSGVEVVGQAQPPASPSAPRPLLTAALAVVLAGLVGVALAVALELGDRRVRDESDLEPFGVSLLGAVPRMSARGGDDDLAAREALATVATNLRFLHDRRRVRAVVLTPADRRDAYATVPLGLSVALLQMGLSVITIETDMRRPRIAELVGAPSSTGLSTILSGFAELDDVLVLLDAIPESWPQPPNGDAAGPFCAVVPAGPVTPSPSGLLAGPVMAQAVDRARQLADVVLLDCAPVGSVGDALTLAELADGTVLVAEVGATRFDALPRALRALGDVPTALLGVVLTNVPRRRQVDYGGSRMPRGGGLVRS